ncbi:MAG: tetratricopeptide repeat protein [Thermoplasmatales archaeon]|nr:tetratricopeptide repeat protein [Thermoplasmatales archaeon]
MIICPVDGEAEIEEGESPCHQCGADLTEFWRMKEFPDIYYNGGVNLAQKGLLDEAIERLITAIALKPNSVESYVVLGKLYAQKGLYDKAVAQWEKALAIDAENEDAKAGKEKIEKKLVKDKALLEKEESKRKVNGLNNFWHNLDNINYFGFLTFMLGIILFSVTVFCSIIYQLNLLDPQKTCNIFTIAGIGAPLMVIGINMLLKGRRRHIFVILGGALSLIGIAIFYVYYPKGWYYPLAGYVDFLYTIGILVLIGNIFVDGFKVNE